MGASRARTDALHVLWRWGLLPLHQSIMSNPYIGRAVAVAVCIHLFLTCASWRYRSPQGWLNGLVDLSPSMALASTALILFFPSSPATSTHSRGEDDAASVSGGADDMSIVDASMPGQGLCSASSAIASSTQGRQSGSKSGPGAFLKRFARGLITGAARVATGSNASNSSGHVLSHELSFSRRRSLSGRSRSSTDGGAPFGTASSTGASHGSASNAGRPTLRRQTSGGRWQPSMARIASGLHLAGAEAGGGGAHDGDDTQSTRTASSSAADSVSQRRGGAQGSASASEARGHISCAAANMVCGHGDHSSGAAALTVPHAGALAVDCVACESSDPLMGEVAVVIRSEQLLQFGALLGESSAELALSQAGAPGAVGGGARSLLGDHDDSVRHGEGWEEVVSEHCSRRGLHYWAWRRYLRRGLYMYKSRTVYEGVTPSQVAAFTFDATHHVAWDDATLETRPISPPSCFAPTPEPSAGGAGANTVATPFVLGDVELEERSAAGTSFMYARSRFPPPMAPRDYVYARRVWAKPDDGGCYMLSRAAPHPSPPAPHGRNVRVVDYVSGIVIRAATPMGSGASPAAGGPCATEVVTVYFEDSHVSSGIMNMGVRKGLWPSVQKQEAALRAWLAGPRASPHLARCNAALARGRARSGALGGGCGPAGFLSVGADMDTAAVMAGRSAVLGGGVAATTAPAAPGRKSVEGSKLRRPASKLAATYHVYVVVCKEVGAALAGAAGFVAGVARIVQRAHGLIAGVGVRVLGGMLQPLRGVASAAYVGLLRAAAEAIAAQELAQEVKVRREALGVSRSTLLSDCPSASSGPTSYPLQRTSSGGAPQPLSRSRSTAAADAAAANGGGKRVAAKRLGRKLMGRLVAVGVRAVGLPLAHQLLSRASAVGDARSPTPPTVMQQGPAQAGGQAAAAPAAFRRTVNPYIAPSFGAPGVDDHSLYLHHDLHMHLAALQQLRQRRAQAHAQELGAAAQGGKAGQSVAGRPPLPRSGTSMSRGVVVDGVIFK